MNTHYNLNLQTSAVPVVVNANQYDKGIRQYTFTVYNGDELADLTDVTAVTFDATKPDGYGLTYNGTIIDGDIVITTTEQLTAVAGGVRATLRLWNADSDVIGSQRIVVNVERNGVDDDTIISDSDIPAIANAETYATTCQTLVNSIASESAQIQEIADNQCIIEDDTANNDVIITQYEQGSGSDVALVNTVNNNTTRITAVEGEVDDLQGTDITASFSAVSSRITTDFLKVTLIDGMVHLKARGTFVAALTSPTIFSVMTIADSSYVPTTAGYAFGIVNQFTGSTSSVQGVYMDTSGYVKLKVTSDIAANSAFTIDVSYPLS